MIPMKQMKIVVIGDEDLTSAMRLAGVNRYYVVEKTDDGEQARNILAELLAATDIGIIAIQEDLVDKVDDMVKKHRLQKKLTPVIIEVPSKYGTSYPDVAAYYKTYVKGIIGFDIEL